MQHLTPLDAGFLETEDSDPHVSLAIAVVAVLEGPAPTDEEILGAVADRMSSIPHAQQKVHTIPLDLTAPEWVDDANFALGHHFRRTALPAPGDDAALTRFVARVMSQRLDRERPLWECWIIEGLAGGRWAVLAKVHHCMADGIAGTRLFEALCDPESTTTAKQLTSKAAPPVSLLAVGQQVWNVVRSMPRNPLVSIAGAVNAVKGLVGIATGLLLPTTPTSLLGAVGRQRRYAIARASMSETREIRSAFGVTVNDVVLAAISGAIRALLIERGEVPTDTSVRTLVPVSVRSEDAAGVLDNRVSLMLPFLPVEIDDPVERLAAVHDRMAAHKGGGQTQAGQAMTTLAEHSPFAPVAWMVRLATHLPQYGVDIVTTNVPGPRLAKTILGREVVEMFPYVPIALRLRMGIAILSYSDQLTFGITGDYDAAPDVAELATLVETQLATLLVRAHEANAMEKELR
jgi:diacylglycerol O-acyltransferase / wax synthase